MASKFCRCIQLWLMILLCWCVLRSDPVTQESESESAKFSAQKVNLGFTEQEATPPLVSIHHTGTILPGHLDQNTLVTRPAIAPATPWDDTQTLSTILEQNAKPLVADNGVTTENQAPEIETPGAVEKHNESQPMGNEEEKQTQSDNFAGTGIKNQIQSLDPVENVNERQDSSFEISGNRASEPDRGNVEKAWENPHEEQEKIVNELPEAIELKIPENEVKPVHIQKPEKQAAANELPDKPTNELADDLVNDPQTSEADEDLTGMQDSLEGTQEDMPSFNEWSQKFLAQEEEKKVQQSNEKGSMDPSIQPKKKNLDRKQNNYASVDCGANIPETNPEAQNAHSILLENKDLYMLNPCSANIWFIVELCDHAHVTSLQLANFEMFSSTVKNFQVSFSTRYPTREWSQLQTFVAEPEKSIQTFTLDPIFAKYIKVEQLSHHGSEHYCPWSLLRVYGNSMVEEYEEHESSQDDGDTSVEEDDSTSFNTTEDAQISQGYLKSATDAVLNFVKETAKKLVNSDKQVNSTNTTNVIKYQDNSSQPLPTKTIVQLMPREDFEPSCHGDNDDALNACLPGSGCGSTEYTSYRVFLQIVHNICGLNLQKAEACFSNISKVLVANTTMGQQLNQSTKERNVDSENVKNLATGKTDENHAVDDEIVSDTREKQNEQESKVGHSQSMDSETSSRTKTETSAENAIPSTVSPDIITSSVTSQSSDCDFDCASPPTPLAQPPLAVKEEPDLREPPTQQPGINPAETISEQSQVSTDTAKSSDSVPSKENFKPSVDSDPKADSKAIPELTITPTPSETSTSATAEATLLAPEKISDSTQGDKPFCGQNGYEGTHLDCKVPQSDSKGQESIPNPHVDVLKITLTDTETKEGTAEPEQANDDPIMDSDFSTHENITAVDPVEEGKLVENENQSVQSDTVGETEKDPKVVETHEADKLDLSKEEKLENIQVEVPVGKSEQHNEMSKEIENEDQNQPELMDSSLENSDTNVLNKSPSVPSGRQCTIQSNNPEEINSKAIPDDPSIIDRGRTIIIDAAPNQAASNAHVNGKKESIFVTLSRKIKALEQNVTMTNLFLEELSQRYRKSMDEMQKKMEKKFAKMSKHSKFLSNVNSSQDSTIVALRTRVEQLQQKLNQATSRLDAINQEVVERHVLGMCLQFVFVSILWFLLRRLGGSKTGDTVASTRAAFGNGHVKNGAVTCSGTDYRQQNGTTQDMVDENNHLEEINASKPLSPEADTKRRRRRKNRPNSVLSEHSLNLSSDQDQNIVSRTAGLLFHTPGSHDSFPIAATEPRSCSADSLNSLTQEERKKSAFSPVKSKKVIFQNGRKDAFSTRACAAEPRDAKEQQRSPRTRLVRSKSSGECYENKLALSDIALSTKDSNKPLSNSLCSLQSTGDPLKERKSRWIWGLS